LLEGIAVHWLNSIQSWLAGHQTDLVVNSLANLPFFLFELLVVAALVPWLVTRFQEQRTKVARGEVLDDWQSRLSGTVFAIVQTAAQLRAGGYDVESKRRAPLLEIEIERKRSEVANEFPVLAAVLDVDSVQISVKAYRALSTLLDQMKQFAHAGLLFKTSIAPDLELFDARLEDMRKRRDKLTGKKRHILEGPVGHVRAEFEWIVTDLNVKAYLAIGGHVRDLPFPPFAQANGDFGENKDSLGIVLDGRRVHKLKARDASGRWAYYFIHVDDEVESEFLKDIGGDDAIDLNSYGIVVDCCFGESPTDDVKRRLKEKYGFDVDTAPSHLSPGASALSPGLAAPSG
jgi:hypothetical protein